MRHTTIQFDSINKEKSLRCDFIFQSYLQELSGSLGEYYTFGELFEIGKDNPVNPDDLKQDFLYCQISDVSKEGVPSPVKLNFDDRSLLDESYYKKIEKGDIISVQENDILISFLLPEDHSNVGKFVRIDSSTANILFTSAFIRLRAKRCPEVMFYCLKSIFYHDIVSVSRIRKGYTGYSTLSEDDLIQLKFNKNIVDKLVANYEYLRQYITNAEIEITEKRQALSSIQNIINSVLGREFGFDYDTFEELRKHKRFIATSVDFANNPDLRFSAKFHREAGQFVMQQLTGITDKKIKHYLAEPIVLGASVSPSDYSDDGDFYYISMATIKNWVFNTEDARLVSTAYSNAKQAKTVKQNDILLARSGEGTIGKVALIEDEDIQGVFADFTMRIRLKGYNNKFAYYYFRSTYFQYLVEIYKKGLGNNTNIFPIVIQEFSLPDISLDEQQRIVDEIQTEIDKQNAVKKEIAALRKEIDDIIENTLNYL